MFFWSHAQAQLTDNFSDGNLSVNPPWEGDTILFSVHSGKLHLMAPPVSGKALISTPSVAISDGRWEVTAEMDFNPSSSNYIKIFLVSDRPDVSGAFNGYFLMIGNTTDEVSLYRQSGTVVTRIIDGRDGRLDRATVRISVRVTSDENGTWELFTKTPEEPDWQTEGAVLDTSITKSGWFGLLCVFTSTRSDKFHFDDVLVSGRQWPDRTPPSVAGITVNSSTQITLEFNEPLDQSSALNMQNYKISESGYQITGARAGSGAEVVILELNELKEGIPVSLLISGVRDISKNTIPETMVQLIYLLKFTVKAGDVIINEIMPDPSPPAGFPEVEYVEIFNRSERYINLENWGLSDGNTTAYLPYSVISPGGFKLIYPSGTNYNFLNGIQAAGFPSLNNSADAIVLYNESGVTIDSLNYSSSWHTVQDKSEGGWSLERIDPDDFCRKKENWASADHPDGGTPGKQNSVYASRPDRTPPVLSDAEPVGPATLLLTFSEDLERNAILGIDLEIKPYSGKILSSVLIAPDQIRVEMDETFQQNIIYRIALTGIRDCPGNLIEPGTGKKFFVVPDTASSADVVINEILFNPASGGVDFIEIFNRSKKFIRLRDWSVVRPVGNAFQNSTSFPPALLPPHGFLVLTEDPLILKNYFPSLEDSLMVEVNLPSLPDDSATVVLMDEKRVVMDSVHYDEKYHLPLIRNSEGLSLERIDPDFPAVAGGNWRTPSRGWPTPGFKNSVTSGDRAEGIFFKPQPPVFSLSGAESFTRINFELSETDYFFSVSVFDAEGRKIKELVNNMNAGTSGFVRWDGDRSDGRPANPGFYLIVADVFNNAGRSERFRSRVVVVK